jgi:hypothetical protein
VHKETENKEQNKTKTVTCKPVASAGIRTTICPSFCLQASQCTDLSIPAPHDLVKMKLNETDKNFLYIAAVFSQEFALQIQRMLEEES